ncbi:MAG: AAA family ATPase [Okeania sp. SIO2C2]|uniref:ParA family protein n=1 Tax=Okeania sp. SIO2C2 TaxID=2607787 RepID=UPI0013BE3C08|nr:AAA family ATPase [Okeania sp. SIO2C2]NEP85751.1 AAA family ATPase [Okeania sp. SIO2C2]
MIPSDIRLYTWVDVEDVLLRIKSDELPKWLVFARCYWDELSIGICVGKKAEAKEWLEEIFEPRFRAGKTEEMTDCFIILESIKGEERTLPIWFEETDEQAPTPKLIPSLSRPGVIWFEPQDRDIQPPEIFPSNIPPIVAFHSFKGGVGRTTHVLALAQALIQEKTTKKRKVLVVDGDLEAPGISWMLEGRLPNPPISFADFLALAHGDSAPTAEEAIKLVSDRLKSALIDGIYFLPAFRSTRKFTTLEVKPEHLIKGAKNPFLLTEILANLGKALGVDIVIIDLRSGLSELATGLILDPRVYRVFVTTLSEQSVAGTKQLLELIAERAISTVEENPLPAVIFTKVPENEQLKYLIVEPEERLLETIQPFLEKDREPVRIITPFAENLLVLPQSLEDVIIILQQSGIVEKMRTFLEWLPIDDTQLIEEKSLTSKRKSLKEKAEKLVYAERSSEISDFFATTPLRNLASRYQNSLPITVIVGAKGSGKTYTFLQIVRRENWGTFARDAGAIEVDSQALIVPILESRNLDSNAQNLVTERRNKTVGALGFDRPQDATSIRDWISDNCQTKLHEGQWRKIWLDIMAWAIGFQPENKDAGQKLTEYLTQQDQQVVFVIDGLEDLFQNFADDKNQQTALRALLQEVPLWLEQQPGRPLGIVIFIRRDMVVAAIHQNAAQMMDRYRPFALKWSREEALRLVVWVIGKFKIIERLEIDKLREMGEEELARELVPLWGKKLGSDRSKEARSAKWVLDALSDFNAQIQSRDLVRLLSLAASNSINDTRFEDRLLIPTGIRDALTECSIQKIEEISLENTVLEKIFTDLNNLPEKSKKTPFTRENMQLLSLEKLKILEDNGVIIREGDNYHIAEIFRLGLGFSQAIGRTKIISLAKIARSRAALD